MFDNTGASWYLTDNLTKHPAGSKVFKFGLDINTNNCYIEFPLDIITSNLIGSGLNIYYTTTLGLEGNIKQGIVNKFLSNYAVSTDDNTDTVPVNDYIVISNSIMSGGQNPETLEEAYRNYKKLIGTYNTLVTRRDYENAIYNLEENSNNIVSNDFITDRTSDINYSQKVIVGSLNNSYTKNFVKKVDNNDVLNSYDIVLYLLQSPSNIQTVEDYNKSFVPELEDETKQLINNKLDSYKSVQHSLYYITDIGELTSQPNKLYLNINNICKLTGTLTTYYKISDTEASDIQDNVIKALVQNYNSRAIDFGNELDYNDLINTIKSADDRIRNISLNTPSYEPTLQYFNNGTNSVESISLYKNENTNINNETIAKMVLSGNVQLFQFQKDFQYDFGQINGDIVNNVAKITTENSIDVGTTAKTLDTNDFIQIITPSLVAGETYSSSVKYASNFTITSENLIDGDMYQLKPNNKLKLIYVDNSVVKSITLKDGQLLKLVGITSMQKVDWADDSPKWEDNTSYKGKLTAGQSIEVLKPSQITIKTNTPYYVISNKKSTDSTQYIIELNANIPYILEDGEYFLYTNSTLDGLVILGSGTTLVSETTTILRSSIVSIDDVLTTEVTDAQTKWNLLPNDILAQENTVVNLTTGDSIKLLSSTAADKVRCENRFKNIKVSNNVTGVEYQFSSEKTPKTISIITIPNYDYKVQIRSNMLLVGNSVVYQKLYGSQKVTLIDKDGNNYVSQADECLLYSYPINLTGGFDIDARVLNATTGQYEVKLDVYTFELSNTNIPSRSEDTDNSIKIDKDNLTSGSITLPFTFNETVSPETADPDSDKYSYYLLPIYANVIKGDTIKITASNGMKIATTIDLSDSLTTYPLGASTTSISVSKVLILINDTNAPQNDLIITFSTTNAEISKDTNIKLGYIKQISKLNTEEIDSENIAGNYYKYSLEANYTNIIDIMNGLNDYQGQGLPGHENFYVYYEVPSSNKVLQPVSGEAYFNPNHVYNKCTIAKIDFKNSSVKVNSSSIK